MWWSRAHEVNSPFESRWFDSFGGIKCRMTKMTEDSLDFVLFPFYTGWMGTQRYTYRVSTSLCLDRTYNKLDLHYCHHPRTVASKGTAARTIHRFFFCGSNLDLLHGHKHIARKISSQKWQERTKRLERARRPCWIKSKKRNHRRKSHDMLIAKKQSFGWLCCLSHLWLWQ